MIVFLFFRCPLQVLIQVLATVIELSLIHIYAEDFIANKSKFFGLVITEEEIIVKVLESIDEYYSEGKAQNICVFSSEYYKKADTLILSARIGGEIIETVEVDLDVYKRQLHI